MATSLTNKESATLQQTEWNENIAPKYFDFDNVNNYRAGIFGYVNEVMANTSEDVYNAVTTVRREFYPNTAGYLSSLYKMAAMQQIDAPMATPATCKAALVIKEEDILPTIKSNANMDNSYYINNNMIFMADNIPFMIDHPIIITGRPNSQIIATPTDTTNGITRLNDTRERYAYTTRYDLDAGKNSLDTSNKLYLENKIMFQYGERILLIQVTLRQVERQTEEVMIQKNAQVEVVTQDFAYRGQIANFEVFYKESDGSAEIQLQKQILGAETPTVPFCQYMLLENGVLRLHFPKNIYFTPKFNSSLRVEIYTTLGEDGNFDSFNGDLVCNTESTTFPKNNSIVISGQIIGPCAGGTSVPDFEDFRREVVYAYATNQTICSDNDLQMYFDKKSMDTRNKVLFFKKRDDVFQRLYGAFMLLKNTNGYVIPSNTLDMRLMRGYIDNDGNLTSDSDFDAYYEQSKRLILKPGAIFRYGDSNTSDRFVLRRDKTANLLKDMSGYESTSNTIRSACRNMFPSDELPSTYEETSDHFIYRFHTDAEVAAMENGEEKVNSLYIDQIRNTMLQYLGKQIKNGDSLDIDRYIRIFTNSVKKEYIPDTESTTAPDVPKVIIFVEYHVTISYFLYTNPFLISVLTSPNAVAYYLTAANETLPCKYAEVASGAESYIQFNMTNLHVTRNALLGENYYKFTINIMPSVDTIENNQNQLVLSAIKKPDLTSNVNYIIAETDGFVESVRYYRHFKNTDGTNRSFATEEELLQYIDDMNYLEDALINSIAHIENYNGSPADMIYDADQDKFIVQKFSTFSGVYDGVYARVKANKAYQNGSIWSLMIRISPVIEFDNDHKENGFTRMAGFTMLYEIGESFNAQNQIATKKATDTGIIKAFMTINGEEFDSKMMQIPLIVEDYVADGDYFVLSAYVATDDEMGSNGTMHLTDGVYYDEIDAEAGVHDWKEVDDKMCYISMDRSDFAVYTFIRYEDNNTPKYSEYLYVKNDADIESGQWTFTNKYTILSEDTEFALIRPIQYIRSTAVAYMSNESGYVVDPDDHPEEGDRKHCKYVIKSSPVVKSEWVKTIANSQYLSNVVRNNYNVIDLIYNYLEENFAIDLKFYNTYGRSRFYRVGNKNDIDYMHDLDRVNITLRIGVNADTLSSVEVLKQRLNDFIRDYIESLNDIQTNGRPIYLMNLMSAIKQNFDEIGYVEYYGINDYGSDIQKIETTFEEEIPKLGYNEYVPEFINIDEVGTGSELVPSIQITMLE